MKPRWLPLLTIVLLSHRTLIAADPAITWLIAYDGKQPPAAPAWTLVGSGTAEVVDGALHVVDDTDQPHAYRASWKLDDPNQEIVIEARVKAGSLVGMRGGSSVWPWRDGAPIGLLISDGRHQEGLVLTPTAVRTFTDRFHLMNTAKEFHDYRLVIRGNDMSIEVDGQRVIRGANAFWKPAEASEPFIQFGSSAGPFTGDSHWQSVRLGVRPATSTPEPPQLKVTVSEPWEIKREDKVSQNRPYLYDMGQGLLLMSVAQGPDALYEPYGVMKSTDAGKTWTPIKGLDQIEEAPQPMVRLKDGRILGASRWCRTREDGALIGHTVHLDPQANEFTMFENQIHVPEEFFPRNRGDVLVFDRHIFADDDGGVTAVVWSRIRNDKRQTIRHAHLLRSTDEGKTWHYFAAIMPGGEPGTARLSATEMTTVIRSGTWMPLHQSWSRDGGKTWSEPVSLEEGCVDPDLEMMSNGVLACSYGRPSSCLMFSIDGGKNWISHRVISERAGYNYTSVQEISPGRLLYVHDAPSLRAVYVDIERIQP